MHRGGALLRLLHVRWRSMASDVEGASLYQFLLSRTGAPFFDSLTAWVYTGLMRDPYGEFMVREAPQHLKEGLTTDFNCQYWQRRFTLVHEQVRAGDASGRLSKTALTVVIIVTIVGERERLVTVCSVRGRCVVRCNEVIA